MTDYAPFLHRLADAAGAAILPHFRQPIAVDNKRVADFDPVTAADREAETIMRALIAETFPDHGIVGEEFGATRPDADHVWVLDPVDGTRAFISGLPTWGVLIGLLASARPAWGMMAQPFTGERFFGNGTEAWYSGRDGERRLVTRRCARLADATLFTTSPHLFAAAEKPAFERVERSVRMSRYGCDCYAYAMLASGFVDLVVEAGLQPYDIVALIPIIEGAGGRVTDWNGGPAAAGGRILAAGDADLHAAAIALLRESLEG